MQKRQTKRTLPIVAIGMLATASLILTAAQCDEGDEPVANAPDNESVVGDAEQPVDESIDCDRKGKRGRHDGHHRKDRRHHKRDGFLSIALAKLDLTDEQRATLEEMKVEGRKHHKKGKDSRGKDRHNRDRGEFHRAIINALETGTVDRAAFEKAPPEDGRLKEFKEKHAERLNTLHATLTPEQRTALVDLMREKMEAGKDEADRRGSKGKGHKGGHSMFSRMLKDVDLSDDQQARLTQLRESAEKNRPSDEDRSKRREEMRAHMTQTLDAFASESFDAATIEPPFAAGERKGKKFEGKAEMLEGIVEILTEEQRLELADAMKNRKPGRGGRNGKGHGKGMRHGR